jgi:hypothetical protein
MEGVERGGEGSGVEGRDKAGLMQEGYAEDGNLLQEQLDGKLELMEQNRVERKGVEAAEFNLFRSNG